MQFWHLLVPVSCLGLFHLRYRILLAFWCQRMQFVQCRLLQESNRGVLGLCKRHVLFSVRPIHLHCMWRRDLPADVRLFCVLFLRDRKLCQRIWLGRMRSMHCRDLPDFAGKKRVRGVRRRHVRIGLEFHGMPELPGWRVPERGRRERVPGVRAWRVSKRRDRYGVPGVLAWALRERGRADGLRSVRRGDLPDRIVGLRLRGLLAWALR